MPSVRHATLIQPLQTMPRKNTHICTQTFYELQTRPIKVQQQLFSGSVKTQGKLHCPAADCEGMHLPRRPCPVVSDTEFMCACTHCTALLVGSPMWQRACTGRAQGTLLRPSNHFAACLRRCHGHAAPCEKQRRTAFFSGASFLHGTGI